MNKKSRTEIAKNIISRVRKEMDKPRLAASVRDGLRAQSAHAVKKPAARSARA